MLDLLDIIKKGKIVSGGGLVKKYRDDNIFCYLTCIMSVNKSRRSDMECYCNRSRENYEVLLSLLSKYEEYEDLTIGVMMKLCDSGHKELNEIHNNGIAVRARGISSYHHLYYWGFLRCNNTNRLVKLVDNLYDELECIGDVLSYNSCIYKTIPVLHEITYKLLHLRSGILDYGSSMLNTCKGSSLYLDADSERIVIPRLREVCEENNKPSGRLCDVLEGLG